MTTTYKVLGQLAPAATTATTLYTAPSQAIASTLSVCNMGSAAATYRVAVRPAGDTLAPQHYICFDAPVQAQDSLFLTLGLSLGSTDVVTVYSSTSTLAFGLFGAEVA